MCEEYETRIGGILENIIKSDDQHEIPFANFLITLMYNLSDSRHKRNLFKCAFGVIFLLFPVFTFLLLFLNNFSDVYLTHNFSNSIFPLMIGSGIIFVFVISIIVYKITTFCYKM